MLLVRILASLALGTATVPTIPFDAEPRLAPLHGLGRCIVVGFPLKNGGRLAASLSDTSEEKGTVGLYDSKGTFLRLIFASNDLKGSVRIHTARQAFALARLFTAPSTCWLGYARRARADAIRAVEVLTKREAPKRKYCVVSDEVAQRFGLKPVSARWTNDHWTVERNLVVLYWRAHEGNIYRTYRSEENVYPDGRCIHQVAHFIASSTGMDMLIPSEAY